MRKLNINSFYDKIIREDTIYFESELLKFLIPKYISSSSLEFYSKPKFIEVHNVQIITEHKMFNQTSFYKKPIESKNSIEPILIKSPNILETYYRKKNIKFHPISKPEVIPQSLIDKEKFAILRVRLTLHKDEINTLS